MCRLDTGNNKNKYEGSIMSRLKLKLRLTVLGLFLLCGMVVPVLPVSAQTETLASAVDKIIIAMPRQKMRQSNIDYNDMVNRYFRGAIDNLVAIYGEGVKTQIIQDFFNAGFISTEVIQSFVKAGVISAGFANTLSAGKSEYTQNAKQYAKQNAKQYVAQSDIRNDDGGIDSYTNEQLDILAERGDIAANYETSITQ